MVLAETRRDFVNLQDRCRAEICKVITSRNGLSKLKLPTKITKYLSEVVYETQISKNLIPIGYYDSVNRV